ncbi:glycogen synthase [Bacteroidota bacterium]|nr:glycogen synthase [Bacteroidota bacterium]
MTKKRVLIVAHEMKPYNILTEAATFVNRLPVYLQEQGMEIRVLMPRFGTINERRHRLHEVVRLSGMNIIIDDDDNPLIIKVASLPGARLQVYFLDNEDYFRRKHVFTDADGKFYEDTHERMAFFCKGVMETIKKFGWPPDIIHCHDWMSSLIPMYLKTVYKKDPVFHNAKSIYSVYDNTFKETLHKDFSKKAIISKELIKDADFAPYKKANNTAFNVGAITHADGVIKAGKNLDPAVKTALKAMKKKPILEHDPENYLATYVEFYRSLMNEK